MVTIFYFLFDSLSNLSADSQEGGGGSAFNLFLYNWRWTIRSRIFARKFDEFWQTASSRIISSNIHVFMANRTAINLCCRRIGWKRKAIARNIFEFPDYFYLLEMDFIGTQLYYKALNRNYSFFIYLYISISYFFMTAPTFLSVFYSIK